MLLSTTTAYVCVNYKNAINIDGQRELSKDVPYMDVVVHTIVISSFAEASWSRFELTGSGFLAPMRTTSAFVGDLFDNSQLICA
jgi:hypothetical protein